MMRFINKITGWTGSPKGAKIVLIGWLAAIIALSGAAPAAKKFAVSAGEGSIHDDKPSAVAAQIMNERFPSNEGLPALVVFSGKDASGAEQRAKIAAFSKWLASDGKPEQVAGSLPFHQLPEAVQDQMFSQDKTTLIFPVSLKKDLASDQLYDTIEQLREGIAQIGMDGMQTEITGPAGIAADTTNLFKNADFVLMFATIGLILVILIIIYRSPLLAVIPLLIAGVVYQAVDRLIGLAGKNGWFLIDKQSLSIMMILLFAVLTDYCLFVFSRYREELRKGGGKYDAMREAMTHVGEPILFSGGTVLMAMLTLFAAVFKPYHHFAPVFSIAMAVILLGGLTLIPAVFALLGRKAFWPFAPKPETAGKPQKSGVWHAIAAFVVKRPVIPASVLLAMLIGLSVNFGTMSFSFNLMKSFPDDISSRKGYELLEQKFPKGQLAPVSVILESDKEITMDEAFVRNLTKLAGELDGQTGVDSVTPEIKPDFAKADTALPRNFLSADKRAIKLQLITADNPYDQSALDAMKALRENSEALLAGSGLSTADFHMHFAGQTAEQVDVSDMNGRDTIVIFSLISVFITLMLLLQTRSVRLSLLMIATILLSYTATMGLGWLIFHYGLGYDAISYRLPVYTFVFLVALGVDYNIMLVSRIREEARQMEWKEAVRRGVALTGGVISSAGLILAATFCVLITQPLQELFLFGLTMALGILMDTFLVRGILLPAIMTLMGGGKSVGKRINKTAQL
ncbi:MMPL family transporter [Paenibacillus contaminans]|uniref:MMPL family transporter n=1 Tax=Paenibacillus contaminans TaxID=450362 RepID=A0A329MLB5_9BACL|nr:MMPL family transporter [Paenibacillus contaminans]RAV20096.1 MMPL family transporter [Paenibacillus contaminans]